MPRRGHRQERRRSRRVLPPNERKSGAAILKPYRSHETDLTHWEFDAGTKANRRFVSSMSRFQSVAGAESKANRSPWSKMYQPPCITSFLSWGLVQPQYPRYTRRSAGRFAALSDASRLILLWIA